MNTESDRRLPLIAMALVGVLAATHLVSALFPGFFEPLASRVNDRLFELRSGIAGRAPQYDDTVVHVDIDDRSTQERGDFYLDRLEYARLVDNLARAEVAAQFHDVIFAAPKDRAGDAELLRATAEAGPIYYGAAVGATPGSSGPADPSLNEARRGQLARARWSVEVHGDTRHLYGATRHLMSFPELTAASRGVGFLDIVPDRDGVYRRTPLLVRDEDAFLPSLALRVVADYLDVRPDSIRFEPGKSLTLRGARRPGSEDRRDIVIPVDRRGRMIVNYAGPWERMRHYSFFGIYDASDDRFAMEDLRDEVSGKIAIVSWVATGAGDIGSVPTDRAFPLSGIHANVINNVLTGEFLNELSLLETLVYVDLPLLLLLVLLASRLSTVPFLAASGVLVAAFCLASALSFSYARLIVDIPRPVIFLVVSALVVAAYQFHVESRARAVLRNTFDAYFPPALVDKVTAHADRLMGSAQKKELSVLFSDIAGFTAATSEMDAGDVRRLLNEYFERMIEIVFRHGGTLDKFIGDGLMVFFGDPETQPDHALRAVRAAVEMQQAVREIDRVWRARGDMPLIIRIGINTGEVIVGNMGSARRVSYTVLGQPVNLAQRLESNAPPGGILISERCFEQLRGAHPARSVPPVTVKGFQEPIPVYEIAVEGGAEPTD